LLANAIAHAQDLTSYWEIKLVSTSNKLVPGKNVDLYQGLSKIYDLSESSSVPGVYYYATVADGEYDIYVNGSIWKTGIWIGGNKVSRVTGYWTGTSPDTLEMPTGHIKAATFEGDGSKITGIAGVGGVDNDGDTIIGSDADADGNGVTYFKTHGQVRGIFQNDGKLYLKIPVLIVGEANNGVLAAIDTNAVQIVADSSASFSAGRLYKTGDDVTGARYAFLSVDDYLNVVRLQSSKAGTVPDGNEAWPIAIYLQGELMTTIKKNATFLFGWDNYGVPAGVDSNTIQLQVDTSATINIARIYKSGGSVVGARYAFMHFNDLNDYVEFSSSKTGTVPGGNAAFPVGIRVAGKLVALAYGNGDLVMFDADSDTLRFNPSKAKVLEYSDGGISLASIDSSGGMHSALDDKEYSFSILDTCKSSDQFGLLKLAKAITITEIAGFTNTGTVTFNIEQRGETTPNTTGTDVLSADLVADNDQQESTSFNDATVPANTWLYYSASAAASGPQRLTVTIRYKVD